MHSVVILHGIVVYLADHVMSLQSSLPKSTWKKQKRMVSYVLPTPDASAVRWAFHSLNQIADRH